MNHFNWSVAILAIVLAFCGVRFNNRLSFLNDKVSDLLEENAELRTIDSVRSLANNDICPINTVAVPHNGNDSSRKYCNTGTTPDLQGSKCVTAFRKADGMKISCKEVVDPSGTSNTNLVDACCRTVSPQVQIKKLKMIVNKNIRNIGGVLANPDIAASMVCPPDTVISRHHGSDTSAAYCNSGTAEVATGSKCASAFMIADGTEISCNEVVDPNSGSDMVEACCNAQPECPVGSKKAVHYGSTSSASYCLSGTNTVKPGSECVGAFLVPGGKQYGCTSVLDTDSRTNKVEACCQEIDSLPAAFHDRSNDY